ncbi:MAG: Holliday junction resolvase RuvX [Hyphomonadaceae bacterium]|nr:Holliday junction resolvase RuvX [Hyphomonadaceae bacterium]
MRITLPPVSSRKHECPYQIIFTPHLPGAIAPLSAAQYKDRLHDNNTKSLASFQPVTRAGNDKTGDYTLALEIFARTLPHGARLIGIDVGSKTLGLALSDVTRNIATGLVTLRRSKFAADADRLLALAAEHQIGGFVVGLPLNLDGTAGPRVQATRAFVRNLAKLTPLPILFWDERLSTVAAERALLEADVTRSRRAAVIDKVAATLILQGALDRMRSLDAS